MKSSKKKFFLDILSNNIYTTLQLINRQENDV